MSKNHRSWIFHKRIFFNYLKALPHLKSFAFTAPYPSNAIHGNSPNFQIQNLFKLKTKKIAQSNSLFLAICPPIILISSEGANPHSPRCELGNGVIACTTKTIQLRTINNFNLNIFQQQLGIDWSIQWMQAFFITNHPELMKC